MKLRFLLLAAPFAVGCGVPSITPNPSPNLNPNPDFVVFDATAYKNKPANLGMALITSISEYDMWGDGTPETNPPNPQNPVMLPILHQLNASQGTALIDIESWPVEDADPSVIADSVQKYLTTIQSFQQIAPDAKLGYYSVAPIRDYWNAIDGPGSSQYEAWQQRNDVVAPIAQQADILMPSIYTFYTDQAGWKKYAIAQISEARRIAPGKPVYAFLCPMYEDSSLTGEYMPADYWKMELETMRQYADGVVIWGGWQGTTQETWDANAPWWLETEAFLSELHSNG